MICIPIVADNLENALQDMAEASKVADIIELRVDYMKNPDLKRLLEGRILPVIVTNRPVREGGRFSGNEEERLALLKRAMELQADYIDIEHDSVQYLCRGAAHRAPATKTKAIVSYHNFHETPDDLTNVYQRLSQSGADIIKIVTFANTITDNIKIYRLLRQAKMPTISFCMGEYGMISRILYKRFGSYLTFASLKTGKESAPGQVNIHALLNTYQIRKQDKHTSIYGLIGNPVSHSISPVIHNTLFREMNFNGVYVPFKVNDVKEFVREFRELNVKGFSVTIPHKESVMGHINEIDPIAQRIGAVNTILNKDGQLAGFNTDCEAAVKVLEDTIQRSSGLMQGENDVLSKNNLPLNGKNVALLGAGGAARAIAFGLKERGALITIYNRNYGRAQSLARDVGCLSRKYEDIHSLVADIVINATPVGMFPKVNETPLDKSILKPGMVIFDTIYNPLETKLLQEARRQGCTVVGGLPMFVRQAAAQFKLWTGQTPSLELIEKVALEKLRGA